MTSYTPGVPIYSSNPDIPPIYGYIPYGKYNKEGNWEETTPSQPSVVLMQSPSGQRFFMYEHSPEAGPVGKNVKYHESFAKSMGRKISTIERKVNFVVTKTRKRIDRFIDKIFG